MLWRNVGRSRDRTGLRRQSGARHDRRRRGPFARLTDIGEDVWLAAIAVPADQLEATIDDCIEARVRGAVVHTNVDGSGIDVDALVARARNGGVRLIGPSSMGVASSRADVGLHATFVSGRAAPGRGGAVVAVGFAGNVDHAPRRPARRRAVVVRLARRSLRRVRQRPPAVLGGRRVDDGDRHVHRVDRQPAPVRPDRPARVTPPADRRRAHRRGRDRPVGWRALPALGAHRGAHGVGDARHRPRPRVAAGDARSTHGRDLQLEEPAHARPRGDRGRGADAGTSADHARLPLDAGRLRRGAPSRARVGRRSTG